MEQQNESKKYSHNAENGRMETTPPADRYVWITAAEAGVLRVWDEDPESGWGYEGPRLVPIAIIDRYRAAEAEFWAASRELGAFFEDGEH